MRFDVGDPGLAPDLEIVAPVRTWGMTPRADHRLCREARSPITISKDRIYSIDENLWGRSIECGVLEDPWEAPPADVFALTVPTATEVVEVGVGFEGGVPVSLDGEQLGLVELIEKPVDAAGGSIGFGRVDMVEGRRVGIKSREVYECPAALALIVAHLDLEGMTLERDVAHEKARLEPRFAELAYDGIWYSPLREAVSAFMASTPALRHGRGAAPLHPRRRASRSSVAAARWASTSTTSPPTTPPTRSGTGTRRASSGCSASASRPGRPAREHRGTPLMTLWAQPDGRPRPPRT